MEKTTALLIHRLRYTETSLIIYWCSPDAGIFKTLAKGALRPKSSFKGTLDLYAQCELQWLNSRRSDLHTLKEVQLVNPYMGLRENYARALAAGYFCRLLLWVAETDTPIPELYELLHLSLGYLNEHNPHLVLVQRFEARLAFLLGLGQLPLATAAITLAQMQNRALPPQRKELLLELEKHSR